MSKKVKVNIPPVQPTVQKTTESASISTLQNGLPLLFSKKNYRLMVIGLGVIFLGFLLMMGKNNDVDGAAVFPAADIYSARRIILAPIVVIVGFLIEIYAILLVKKNS